MDINYSQNKIYSKSDLEKLNAVWINLYKEFNDKRNNKETEVIFNKNIELLEIVYKLEILNDMQDRLILLLQMSGNTFKEFRETRRREIINQFKDLYPKVKFNIFIETEEILELVKSVIKSQSNIYFQKSGSKDKKVKKEEKSIEYIVSVLGNNLGYNIDMQTMTCEDFIAKEKLVYDLSQIRNQENNIGKK